MGVGQNDTQDKDKTKVGELPEEEQEKYRRFFEERACAATQKTLTFSPQGDVRVCSQERRIYGNILKDDLFLRLLSFICGIYTMSS